MKRIYLCFVSLLMAGSIAVAGHADPVTQTAVQNSTNAIAQFGANAVTNIFDQGPFTGAYTGNWSNRTSGQNFAEKFSFATDMVVTDIHIYTQFVPVGGPVHVKILDDVAGTPVNYIYEEDGIPTSWIMDPNGSGYYVVTATLAVPFHAVAGTIYWAGVSGNGFDLGQISLKAPGDAWMAQFSGRLFTGFTSMGDMMFQLSGVAAAPPPTPDYAIQTGWADCLNLWLEPDGSTHGNVPAYGTGTVLSGMYDGKTAVSVGFNHLGVEYMYVLDIPTRAVKIWSLDTIGSTRTLVNQSTWTLATSCPGIMSVNNGGTGIK